jgi:hypothetical protein
LRSWELPTSKRQQSEILAPLIFADHAAGTDPTCERAGCGLWLEVIGGSYIFFRRTSSFAWALAAARRAPPASLLSSK